jgi:hypothetical protein
MCGGLWIFAAACRWKNAIGYGRHFNKFSSFDRSEALGLTWAINWMARS